MVSLAQRRTVTHETPGNDEFPFDVTSGNCMACRQLDDLSALSQKQRIRCHKHGISFVLGGCRESGFNVAGAAGL